MRSDEEFVGRALVEFFGGSSCASVSDGEDPPDLYLTAGPSRVGVEVTRLSQFTLEPGYFAPPPSVSASIRMLSRVLNLFVKGKAAILDTGVLSHHPLLRKRLLDSVDFTGEGPEDRNGHGTVVGLIFINSAPGSSILNVKVLDQDKEGMEEDLIEGMRWAQRRGADVVNMSVGITRDCGGDCDICTEANRLARAGIIVTAAAGNEGLCCPARARDVMAVGAAHLGNLDVKRVGLMRRIFG